LLEVITVAFINSTRLIRVTNQPFVTYWKSIYLFLVCVYKRLVIDPVINRE